MFDDTAFDCYHKWLGIPPLEQPPNYYRLLGIAVSESDPEVIEAAADQRMAFVRQLAVGQYVEHSQRLLTELAQARVCLLDSVQSKRYQLQLQRLGSNDQRRPAIPESRLSHADDDGDSDASELPLPPLRTKPRASKPSRAVRRTQSQLLPVKTLIAVVIIISGAAVTWLVRDAFSPPMEIPTKKVPPLSASPQVVNASLDKSTEAKFPSPALNSTEAAPETEAAADATAVQSKLVPAEDAADKSRTNVAVAESSIPTPAMANHQPPALLIAPCSAADAAKHQRAWADSLKLPVEITNSIGMKLRLIPPGEYTVGLPEDDPSRKADPTLVRRRQRFQRPWYMGATEVTRAQFQVFVTSAAYRTAAEIKGSSMRSRGDSLSNKSSTPEKGYAWNTVDWKDSGDYPMTNVDWNDALRFLQWLSQVDNARYRLPTEAEWESGCRAGTDSAFWFGTGLNGLEANVDGRAPLNKPPGTFRARPWTVGTYPANPFGLFDVHGNVWELCSAEPESDPPPGNQSMNGFVSRGGSWWNPALFARSTSRLRLLREGGDDASGFRVVREIEIPAPEQPPLPIVGASPDPQIPGTALRPETTGDAGPYPLKAPFDSAIAQDGQAAWAKALGQPVVVKNSLGMELVLIPPGEFLMGASDADVQMTVAEENTFKPEDFAIQQPQLPVQLTNPFRLAQTEVTQRQWQTLMKTTPWKGQPGGVNNLLPANFVSWNDACEFCQRLSQKEGQEYRLPTEAEWEWSCRAGTTTRFSFGDDSQDLTRFGAADNRLFFTGTKLPNAFGLFDMHGNLGEWSFDTLERLVGGIDPQYSTDEPMHAKVFRGGHYRGRIAHCRSAARGWNPPTTAAAVLGFRPMMVVKAVAQPAPPAVKPDPKNGVAPVVPQPPPSSYGIQAEIYDGTNFQQRLLTRVDRQIDWRWIHEPPGANLPVDNYSIRWNTWLKVPRAGRYKLIVVSDDGVRLWLDNRLLINDWNGHLPTRNVVEVQLGQKPIALRIEYFETNLAAMCSLRWEALGVFSERPIPPEAFFIDEPTARKAVVPLPVATPPEQGLQAEYFGGREYEPQRKLRTLAEDQIDRLWGYDAPPEDFCVRWTGQLHAPKPGRYSLRVISDDGARVWLDDKLVIDRWVTQETTRGIADVELVKEHAFRVEYFNVGKTTGLCTLRWIPAGETTEVTIPSEAFRQPRDK